MESIRTTDGASLMDAMAITFGGIASLRQEIDFVKWNLIRVSSQTPQDMDAINRWSIALNDANEKYINAAVQTQVLDEINRRQKIAA